CGCGQRMGIFSGPGVGKSVLLGMIARYTSADITVIGLVGERGREVREFIEKDLGEEGLKRSVVVVSTSDESAPLRVRAGFVAATIAEYFRDKGKNVLLLLDSVTRIALAQRQIGLAMAEPPATKGFTPSVFGLLPKLIERCGITRKGSISGFFTVLVEGDDIREPISDAMRGLLDGHLWLSRNLANRGHYPAIDVVESISRVMPDIVSKDHLDQARMVMRLIALYRDIEDLVNIGAYAGGLNEELDLAVKSQDAINAFLQQSIEDKVSFEQAQADLKNLLTSLYSAQATKTNGNPASGTAVKNKQAQAAPGMDRVMAGL
ncbi:MAG: FliI/YscN family ATPase, partial [Planctomycetes bacterium]|nr:FliI/YscN family ATPase [Planctomycetota bacterium]